jgi:hypothetical protein
MRPPRFRYTLFGLIVLVAMIAIGFGTWVVGTRSNRGAQFHRAKAEQMTPAEQVLRDFYERVRTQTELIQQFLDLHENDEIGEGDPTYSWDNSVDKKPYEGSQRADYIASVIYEMRFGGSLYDDLYNLYYDKGRQPRRDFDAR